MELNSSKQGAAYLLRQRLGDPVLHVAQAQVGAALFALDEQLHDKLGSFHPPAYLGHICAYGLGEALVGTHDVALARRLLHSPRVVALNAECKSRGHALGNKHRKARIHQSEECGVVLHLRTVGGEEQLLVYIVKQPVGVLLLRYIRYGLEYELRDDRCGHHTLTAKQCAVYSPCDKTVYEQVGSTTRNTAYLVDTAVK